MKTRTRTNAAPRETATVYVRTFPIVIPRNPDHCGAVTSDVRCAREPKPSSGFSVHPPVTDQGLKSLERQVPAHTGEPLPADEEWRALEEICKTT
jgi:hypothetical protein